MFYNRWINDRKTAQICCLSLENRRIRPLKSLIWQKSLLTTVSGTCKPDIQSCAPRILFHSVYFLNLWLWRLMTSDIMHLRSFWLQENLRYLRVYPWISWCPTLNLISWCATLQFWLSLHKYLYLLGTCINFTWFSIPVTLSRHQYIKLYLHRITNFKISL